MPKGERGALSDRQRQESLRAQQQAESRGHSTPDMAGAFAAAAGAKRLLLTHFSQSTHQSISTTSVHEMGMREVRSTAHAVMRGLSASGNAADAELCRELAVVAKLGAMRLPSTLGGAEAGSSGEESGGEEQGNEAEDEQAEEAEAVSRRKSLSHGAEADPRILERAFPEQDDSLPPMPPGYTWPPMRRLRGVLETRRLREELRPGQAIAGSVPWVSSVPQNVRLALHGEGSADPAAGGQPNYSSALSGFTYPHVREAGTMAPVAAFAAAAMRGGGGSRAAMGPPPRVLCARDFMAVSLPRVGLARAHSKVQAEGATVATSPRGLHSRLRGSIVAMAAVPEGAEGTAQELVHLPPLGRKEGPLTTRG